MIFKKPFPTLMILWNGWTPAHWWKELIEFHILHCLFTQLLLSLLNCLYFNSLVFFHSPFHPTLPPHGGAASKQLCDAKLPTLHEPQQSSWDPGCSKNLRICDMIVEDTVWLGSWQDPGKTELLQYFGKLDQETCWRS